MKTILLTAGFLLASFSIAAQEINPQLYQADWLDDETRTIYGYEITKIFGQLPNNPATYNYTPITAVAYKDNDSLVANFKKVAAIENWTEELLNKNIANLDSMAKGGQIQVYLTRYREESANFKWFFIIIRAMDDKTKLWEHDLSYQAPQNPVNTGWWNYTTVEIPVELPDRFYIYFNDKNSPFLSDFKFLVEKESE